PASRTRRHLGPRRDSHGGVQELSHGDAERVQPADQLRDARQPARAPERGPTEAIRVVCGTAPASQEVRMTLEEDFLTTAGDKLAENMERIETCVGKLPDDVIWARGSENENAVGNLLLHLTGNVRQWILSGIVDAPDQRDRPSEFAARAGAPGAALATNLRLVVDEAVRVIRTLPHARLAESVRIQGYDTTVLGAI